MENFDLRLSLLSREAQLFVGWVSGSVTHAGVGFHASNQPTFILYLIPPTYLNTIENLSGLANLYIAFFSLMRYSKSIDR
ncbi:MAG: hypothetical protein EWV48_05260 [Microcystis aeruginosa Ma_QC_C_20070823_S13]|jgi:hypothetical protein|nr:MAG: hypothetical protein EWV56_12920 [Microcystis aeruginosa Ma_QC_C_20070823_S13D]TRU64924.1 MAG: hypothetical protein EWV48_05260 [Microcystis aeruginosa Ma_QC_C_20070823_S13]